ncbi:MAG: flagellar protein FliO/FliZ [Halioglobus sp.]|jgi:flagellar protein FliO/FliZ
MAAAADKTTAEIFDGGYLLQVFGALLLVFACLFGLMFVLKKVNGMPLHNKGLIQVLGSAKVGTREKIVLLRAGEQHLLIGVGSGNVRTLHVFDGNITGLDDEGAVNGGAFAAILQASSAHGEVR